MAGHSKYANTKHRKSAQDAKKSKNITRAIRAVLVAAKTGSTDPELNPKLRLAINFAKSVFVPKDKIDGAIKRALSGGDDEAILHSVRYNANISGVAMIIEASTDNKNRTAGEVRAILTKNGGSMVETGSVEFMFKHIGLIAYPITVASEDVLYEKALDCGVDNVENDEENYYLETEVVDLFKVTSELMGYFDAPTSSELVWQTIDPIEPQDQDHRERVVRIYEALMSQDDVEHVFCNMDELS